MRTPNGVQEGDRIRLVSMPNDPCPIKAGSEGTVQFVHGFPSAAPVGWQIAVEWEDPTRSLALAVPPDEFEVVVEPCPAADVIDFLDNCANSALAVLVADLPAGFGLKTPDGVVVFRWVCPTSAQPGIDPADDIIGCGSSNITGDRDGGYDCGDCGIVFAIPDRVATAVEVES